MKPIKVPSHIECSADFSEDKEGPDGRGKYRFTLWRKNLWGDEPPIDRPDLYDPELRRSKYVQFICLNPSTADENFDDPTVQRCWKRTRDLGYGAFVMTNLFAYRATDPKWMKAHPEPIGEWNNDLLWNLAEGAGMVICAWGGGDNFHKAHQDRDIEVLKLLKGHIDKLHYLALTTHGHYPRHPLYLANALRPQPVKPLWRNFLQRG